MVDLESMLFFACVGVLSYNYKSIISVMVYGSGLGHTVKCNSGYVTQTTLGTIRTPTIKLPSFEWELRFYPSLDLPDGLHDNTDILRDHLFVPTNIINTTLLCEYMYPGDIAPGEVKGCLISEFDDVCHVFTLEDSVPIDYKKYCKLFEQELENF